MFQNSASEFNSVFAETIFKQKYAHEKEDGTKESWSEMSHRVSKEVFKSVKAKKSLVQEVEKYIREKKFCPGGRYLYAAGRPFHQVQNCLLLRAEDSRESWAEIMNKATMALMTGAGIGIDYSALRGEGKIIRKTGGTSTGPIALMKMVNEAGREIMQGGARRSAIWAGLNWNHSDIMKFIYIKDWSKDVKDLKAKDFNFPAPLDMTNISVQLDDLFFKAYNDEKHTLHSHAHVVYWAIIENMMKTGEPGFSIDTGKNTGETLRNACVTGDTIVSVIVDGEEQKIDVESLISLKKDFNCDILIKSFNEQKEVFEYKNVSWADLTKENTKVLKITDEKTKRIIKCTADHLILTKRGYIRADELKEIDELILD